MKTVVTALNLTSHVKDFILLFSNQKELDPNSKNHNKHEKLQSDSSTSNFKLRSLGTQM